MDSYTGQIEGTDYEPSEPSDVQNASQSNYNLFTLCFPMFRGRRNRSSSSQDDNPKRERDIYADFYRKWLLKNQANNPVHTQHPTSGGLDTASRYSYHDDTGRMKRVIALGGPPQTAASREAFRNLYGYYPNPTDIPRARDDSSSSSEDDDPELEDAYEAYYRNVKRRRQAEESLNPTTKDQVENPMKRKRNMVNEPKYQVAGEDQVEPPMERIIAVAYRQKHKKQLLENQPPDNQCSMVNEPDLNPQDMKRVDRIKPTTYKNTVVGEDQVEPPMERIIAVAHRQKPLTNKYKKQLVETQPPVNQRSMVSVPDLNPQDMKRLDRIKPTTYKNQVVGEDQVEPPMERAISVAYRHKPLTYKYKKQLVKNQPPVNQPSIVSAPGVYPTRMKGSATRVPGIRPTTKKDQVGNQTPVNQRNMVSAPGVYPTRMKGSVTRVPGMKPTTYKDQLQNQIPVGMVSAPGVYPTRMLRSVSRSVGMKPTTYANQAPSQVQNKGNVPTEYDCDEEHQENLQSRLANVNQHKDSLLMQRANRIQSVHPLLLTENERGNELPQTRHEYFPDVSVPSADFEDPKAQSEIQGITDTHESNNSFPSLFTGQPAPLVQSSTYTYAQTISTSVQLPLSQQAYVQPYYGANPGFAPFISQPAPFCVQYPAPVAGQPSNVERSFNV